MVGALVARLVRNLGNKLAVLIAFRFKLVERELDPRVEALACTLIPRPTKDLRKHPDCVSVITQLFPCTNGVGLTAFTLAQVYDSERLRLHLPLSSGVIETGAVHPFCTKVFDSASLPTEQIIDVSTCCYRFLSSLLPRIDRHLIDEVMDVFLALGTVFFDKRHREQAKHVRTLTQRFLQWRIRCPSIVLKVALRRHGVTSLESIISQPGLAAKAVRRISSRRC